MFRHGKIKLTAAILLAATLSVLGVAVMGLSPAPDVVKLSPVMVSVDTSTLPPKLAQEEMGSVRRLFDRDTETAYMPTQTVQVTVSLPELTTISRIRVYGASSYTLNVYRDNSGTWEPVSSLSGISLVSLFGSAWNSLKPEASFTATHLLFEFVPQGNVTAGLSEVEVWGDSVAGSVEGLSYITTEGIKIPQDAITLLGKDAPHILEVVAAPSELTVPDGSTTQSSGVVRLSVTQDPALFKRAYLIYDGYNIFRSVSIQRRINAFSWSGGLAIPQPEGTTAAWSSFVEEINPAWLVQGENTIEIKSLKGTAYVRGLKLIVETDSGWNAVSSVSVSTLYDADITTSYAVRATSGGSPVEVYFDRLVQPDVLRLHIPGAMNVRAGLQYYAGGTWRDSKNRLAA